MKHLPEVISQCIELKRSAQQELYAYTYRELCVVVAVYAKDHSEKDWIFNLGMMRVFNSLKNYKIGTNYLGWARTILVRSAIDHLRKNKLYNQHLSTVEIEKQEISSNDFDAMMSKIDSESIINLIQKLPENQRLIFNLFELGGYSHKEIEEMTNINYNTSKWILSKAKKSLREMIHISKELNHVSYGK